MRKLVLGGRVSVQDLAERGWFATCECQKADGSSCPAAKEEACRVCAGRAQDGRTRTDVWGGAHGAAQPWAATCGPKPGSPVYGEWSHAANSRLDRTFACARGAGRRWPVRTHISPRRVESPLACQAAIQR
jgi:hypothetical protein